LKSLGLYILDNKKLYKNSKKRYNIIKTRGHNIMHDLSIIIPSLNEPFLQRTIDDILEKAKTNVEIIAVLDGYWPESLTGGDNLRIVHKGKTVGMRSNINAAARIAKGKYLLKCDAHCMFDEGFDAKLIADCEKDWISIPTRKRLDAEKWCPTSETGDTRPDINYLYVDSKTLGGTLWTSKNEDRSLDEIKIDDCMTFQGSCWFMHRDYFFELGGMDEENYGTFRKEPQELTFKCWLSGGRIIRNKNTWYAHLHKGNKYGRGYKVDKTDWAKGDEYILKWSTDEAWDKQTIPFKWLIEKFNPPGWENVTLKADDKKLKPVARGRKVYQNLKIEGENFNPANTNRENSKFWNEGKFQNFIKPHLPEDCSDMTFVEMGTNAGLFLRMAKDLGFRNAVGIEKDRTPVAEGKRYRDLLGYDYKILKRTLGGKFGDSGNFDFDEIPVADYTLMSTFHYYIDINSWLKYLDTLSNKTRYCIIVSRHVSKKHWMALSDLPDVRKYFEDWEQVNYIPEFPKEGDPNPRDLWSICFKSKLERINIDDIKIKGSDAVSELANEIKDNDDINPFETKYYKKWVARKNNIWNDKTIKKFVADKTKLLIDIKNNGQRDPLIVQEDNKLSDGGHRLAMLKALGYKNVIVRRV